MAHIHKFGEASTGKDIPTGGGQHTHLFQGERLSSDPDGAQHTHINDEGEESTGPMDASSTKKLADSLEVRNMTEEARTRMKS